MFNRLQSPAVSRCWFTYVVPPLPAVTAPNPNVDPLPALDEATLTVSPTHKLQHHSYHDPMTYTRLAEHHLRLRQSIPKGRCLTNCSDPQLRYPHPKVGAYHYLCTIYPHLPSAHCSAPLRGNDVQRLRYAHATSYSCPRYPMHIPGRF